MYNKMNDPAQCLVSVFYGPSGEYHLQSENTYAYACEQYNNT